MPPSRVLQFHFLIPFIISAADASLLVPSIWPADAFHREHMDTWCNGTALRETGGVGLSPFIGSVGHINHMAGYCKARGAVHAYADELWAGPPKVAFAVVALAAALMCLCTRLVICACCHQRIKRSENPHHGVPRDVEDGSNNKFEPQPAPEVCLLAKLMLPDRRRGKLVGEPLL